VVDLTAALEVLRGRRVLVTGSTGFKGSWICNWLSTVGAKVFGFALPPEPDAPLFNQLRLDQRIRQTYGDVRDLGAVAATFAAVQPEVVIHLAAQALVLRAYQEPKLTLDVNIGGATNLLEAVRSTPSVTALVFITSDKCYLNKEWIWAYRENDELGGADPYSSSKAAAELVFACYQHSYFGQRPNFLAASARAGNVIGGGDRSNNRIVPDCIQAISTNTSLRLRNPNATRPWQHVLEPLSGYLLLAARLVSGAAIAKGSWNFGPNVENVRTVQELATGIGRAWGHTDSLIEFEKSEQHEAQLLMLSNEKAKTQLGWAPRWHFCETIDKTVAWYRAIDQNLDPVSVTDQQIADYLGDVS
jgi:CDP-glucose 4,6-dehydratase